MKINKASAWNPHQSKPSPRHPERSEGSPLSNTTLHTRELLRHALDDGSFERLISNQKPPHPERSEGDLDDESLQPRQSDDHYWQQQSKLQQSAITFKSRKTQENVVELTHQKDTEQAPIPSSQTTAIENTDISQMWIRIEKSNPETVTLSKQAIQSLIKYIEQSTEQPSYMLEQHQLDYSDTTVKSTPIQLNKPIIFAESILKPYQLFLTNNQIELSLNTAHLSKQQVADLHLLIKEWLAEKGYSLKQLIINGIPQ